MIDALAASLRTLDLDRTIALGEALRAGGRGLGLPPWWLTIDHEEAEWLLARSPAVLELAMLLSMHRNGYAREVAFERLEHAADPLVLRFLALRLDDVVPAIRDRARAMVDRWLASGPAEALVTLLPLFDRLAKRQRAAGGPTLRAVQAALVAPGSGWRALLAASGSPDVALRGAAIRLAVRDGRRGDELARLLGAAIGDADPAIARWAAIELTSTRVDADLQRALLGRLELHRDPAIRRRAVLARARLPDGAPQIERALLDRRVDVRFTAREKLPPGRGRPRYLAVLADPTTTRDQRLGAIGGLAEAGHASDAPLVLGLLDDPDPVLRAEAVRCVGALAPLEHRAALERAAADPSSRVRREARRGLTTPFTPPSSR